MDTLNKGCKLVIFFILFEKYRRGNVFREDFSREGKAILHKKNSQSPHEASPERSGYQSSG